MEIDSSLATRSSHSDSVASKQATPPPPELVTDGGLPIYPDYCHLVYGNIDFVGDTFTCGLVGSAAFHFLRGVRGAPNDGGRLGLAAGGRAVRANAPRVAGRFGATCVVFTAMERAVSVARGSEIADWWSGGAGTAITWGLHGMRRGGAPAAAGRAFLGASAVVAMVESEQALTAWCCRDNDRRWQQRKDLLLAMAALTPSGNPAAAGSGESATLVNEEA
ncbi:hypothetical protein ACP4OV_005317 [Aristida adscensionis]